MQDELYKLFHNSDLFALCSGTSKSDRWHFCVLTYNHPYYCFIFDGNLFVIKHESSPAKTTVGTLLPPKHYNIDEILLDEQLPKNIKDFIIFNLNLFSPNQGESL